MYGEYPRRETKLPEYGPLPPLPSREQGKLKRRGSTTDVRAWAMQPEIHSEYIHEWITRPTEPSNSFPVTTICKLMFANDSEANIQSDKSQTSMPIGEMTDEEIKTEISRVMLETNEAEQKIVAKELSQNSFIPIEKEIHDKISHEIYEKNAEESDQEERLSIHGDIEEFVKEFSQNRFMPIENEIRCKISREIYEENAEEIDQINETILPTGEELIQRESSSTDLTRAHNSENEMSIDISSDIYKQIDEMLDEAFKTVLSQIKDEAVLHKIHPKLEEMNISELENLIAENKQAFQMLEQEHLLSEQLSSCSENVSLAATKSKDKIEGASIDYLEITDKELSIEKSCDKIGHETGKVDDLLLKENTTTKEKDENSKIEQINKAGPSKKESAKRKCPCKENKSPVTKCNCKGLKKKGENSISEKESHGEINEEKSKLLKEEKDQILFQDRNDPLNERDKPFSEGTDDLPSGEIDQLVKEEREETFIEEDGNKPASEERDKLLRKKIDDEISVKKSELGVEDVDIIDKVQVTEQEFIDSEIAELAEDIIEIEDINKAELTEEGKNEKCVKESIKADITQMEKEIDNRKPIDIQREVSKLGALEINGSDNNEKEVLRKLTDEGFDLEQLSTHREIGGLDEITKSEGKVNSAIKLLSKDKEIKEGISTDNLANILDLKSDLDSQAAITIDNEKRKISHVYSNREIDITRPSIVVGSAPLYESLIPAPESGSEENILVDDNKDDELETEQGITVNNELGTEIAKVDIILFNQPSTNVVNALDSDKGSSVAPQPIQRTHCIDKKCEKPEKCKSQRLLNSHVKTTTKDAKCGSDSIECTSQQPLNLLVMQDAKSGSDRNEYSDNWARANTPNSSPPNLTAKSDNFTKEVSDKINDILSMIDEFKSNYANLENLDVNYVEENNNEGIFRALETIKRAIETLQINALASTSNRRNIEALEEIERLKDICGNLQNNLKAAACQYRSLKLKSDKYELAHEESKELCKLRNELNIAKTLRSRLEDYIFYVREINTDCHSLRLMIKNVMSECMQLRKNLKDINGSIETDCLCLANEY